MPLTIPYDFEALSAFCHRHGVSGFFVFGSVARGDSRPDSDIDVLLEFRPQQQIHYSTSAGCSRTLRIFSAGGLTC